MTERPGYTPDQVLQAMSLPRRVSVIVAGLGGLTASATIGLLWATEPMPLPAATQLAFAAMILIGLTWVGFAGWALVRRPLFAVDRVITGWLAVLFSTVTTAGTVTIAVSRASAAGVLAAGGLGLILIVASSTVLVRARAYRAALLARKRELESVTNQHVADPSPPPPVRWP